MRSSRMRFALALFAVAITSCDSLVSAGDVPIISVDGPSGFVPHPGPWTVRARSIGSACDRQMFVRWTRLDTPDAGIRPMTGDADCLDMRAEIPRQPIDAHIQYQVTYKTLVEPAEPIEFRVMDPDDFIFIE